MWSRTWAIALAIISRLTVTDCFGPPLHRPYPSAAERARDPEGEIDAAYRTREELARENALKHLKLPIQNGNSVSDAGYSDDTSEPRHRYHGGKSHHRIHDSTEEKPPDTASHRRQGFQQSSFHGLKIVPARFDHRQSQLGTARGHLQGSETDNLEPAKDDDPKESAEEMIRSAPHIQIRSGIESFQPIAAAIAMQENINALKEAPFVVDTPPPPVPPVKHPEPSDHEIEIPPEPPHPQTIGKPIDDRVGENEVLRPVFDHEEQLDSKGVQAALQQSRVNVETDSGSLTEVYFLAVIAGCSVAGFLGLVLAGVYYYRLRKKLKATSDVEYPAYGVTGPNKEREGGAPGDRKLAQSAQMYHYQHQKQQMIASERLNSDVNHRGGSDAESEDENEEGDYTVFECPGLATNGDMEVRNPLFNEQTPVTAPSDIPGTPSKK